MKVELINNNNQLFVTQSSDLEAAQLGLSFKVRTATYWNHPLVKAKKWDGFINFYRNNKYISTGLWKVLIDMCERFNFNINKDFIKQIIDTEVTYEEVELFFKDFLKNSNLDFRPYQIETVYMFAKYKRMIAEVSTSAGKTFIIYMIFQFIRNLLAQKGIDVKMLLIVPNISLVIQTYQEWQELEEAQDHSTFKALMVHGDSDHKKENIDDYNVIIGTYQSLVKKPQEFFDKINCVFVDESQSVGAKSLKTILEKCHYALYRMGISGTTKIKGADAESYGIQEALGPLLYHVTPEFLIENEYATKVKVKRFILSYLDDENRKAINELAKRKSFDKAKLLSMEKDFVIHSSKRLAFLMKLLNKTSKNSLVLFGSIEKEYGKSIYNAIRKNPDKEAFYVDGGTNQGNRNIFKDEMEEGNNKILVASFGTFATGISIKNIHNIFLVESFKSEVIIKQSIGRGMRLLEGKDFVNIIDLIDDFRVLDFKDGKTVLKKGGKKNYLYKHGEERNQIYHREGYPVTTYKMSL